VAKTISKSAPARRIRPVAQKSVARQGKALPPADPHLFESPEAKRIKKEICTVGRKLWLRQFVDGNGGNISYRIGPNEIICTPTLLSKFDLRPKDLCMVDLDGNQIAGEKKATSEILLHLEIYKKVPRAKAAVHCHPPHATAYAVTGLVPPDSIIPEFEIFVGQVAIAPYETPGTHAFARTVLPFVEHHNTVLLKNHGVVSWAETPTLAEWNCEVLETYCNILAAAAQLGAPISLISEAKCADLMARKRRMGLPDIRFVTNGSPAKNSVPPINNRNRKSAKLSPDDLEALVKRVTRAVLKEIGAS
jgi:L-fuculose-phosphate aldolase